ncbi:MAG: hypothetical protein J5J06_07400 [Phycisphaerae bacterium]|nr:hypothetical protein [Phycisphaerae bacterium]
MNPYPELDRVPDAKERRAIRRKAFRSCLKSPRVVASILAFSFGGSLLMVFLQGQLSESLPVGGRVTSKFIAAFVAVWIAQRVFLRLGDGPIRRAIRQIMTERGYPTCVQCGYNLTGLESPRCPECGQPFAPGFNTNPKN